MIIFGLTRILNLHTNIKYELYLNKNTK